MLRHCNALAWITAAVLAAMPTAAQPPAEPAAAPAADAAPQAWKGQIELPGTKLEFAVVLRAGPPASGTIDIPMQGLNAGPLSDVTLGEKEIRFTLALPGMPEGMHAAFAVTPAADGRTAQGTLTQGGVTARVTMRRLAPGESAAPRRPQEPTPPYPYTQREVTYTNPADGTTLAGTLTIPEGTGPFPAVVMITGSGPQDRDESVFGHRPFLVIADHLTRRGIAVLRADDRGIGGSKGSVAQATADDSVGDVLAGVALLRTLPEIDAAHVGVIGHSEGGIIGPMASARSGDVAFVVMLAGTGLKGRDILTLQSSAIYRAAGIDEERIARAAAAHRTLMDLAERGATRDELAGAIRDLMRVQMEITGTPPMNDEQLATVVGQQLESLQTRWFRSFLTLDPREALRRVKAPVLALNGSLDVQVPPKENLAEIQAALALAGNTDVTIRELPGLNHLFQHAGTGGPDEYGRIEETFAPEALDILTDWIAARTRNAK
jgi:hypothetical protein